MRISITLLLFTALNFIINAQGLKFDPVLYDSLQAWEPEESFGYTAKPLPSKLTYRKYVPAIQSQGKQSTCVGFSVAYSQLSTQQNIAMGISDPLEKMIRSMDPFFIYSLIKDANDTWCEKGTMMSQGMEVLKLYGCKPLIWEPWLECNTTEKTITEFPMSVASMYKIKEYYSLRNDQYFISNTKTTLNHGFLVSVGIELTNSFMSGNASKYGNWTPSNLDTKMGGHAMCVIGYDDYKNGGSFEVMNSYGKSYGDAGFVWIKYQDFKKYVKEAYIIETEGFKNESCSFGDCYNSFSRYKYTNGDLYEGATKLGLPNIYGSYLYSNGDFYIGDYSEGRKHGYGIFYSLETAKYYKTYFENDVLIRSTEKFGFAAKENDDKINALFDKLTQGEKKNLISPGDTEYQKFSESLEIPEQPLMLK